MSGLPALAGVEHLPEGCQLVLSASGGKDSTALGVAFRRLGLPFRAVFANTGWEHPLTLAYVREVLPELLGVPVAEVTVEIPLAGELEGLARQFEDRLGFYSPMVRRILRHAMFPSRTMKWCTQELKLLPIAQWVDALPTDPVMVTGIRAEESQDRAKFPVWEEQVVDLKPSFTRRYQSVQTHWRPALHWTWQQVRDVLVEAASTNPLYLAGAERVGCWPCINSRRRDLRLLAQDPARVGLLRDLEAEVERIARAAGRIEPDQSPPRFFQALYTPPDDAGQRHAPCWPIDDAIAWAKGQPRQIYPTGTGFAQQQELFWAAGDGCRRWGLCPTEGPPSLDSTFTPATRQQ